MSTRSYLIAVFAAFSAAQAHAADEPAGYLISSVDGTPVTAAHGECVHTSRWTPDTPYRQCSVTFTVSIDALFEFDSAVLSGDAAPALDELARQLAPAEYQTVTIIGRADRLGRAKYNQQLSEQRAAAVRDHLAARGIDGSRIAVSGIGASASVTGSRCEGLEGKALIACLQPDRSAHVKVIGTQTSAMR